MELNDICNVITCGVAKRPNYVESGVPFLSSKNVKENNFILDSYNYVSEQDFLALTKNNKPEKGDILYTRVGSFGEAAVINFDFDFAIFVSLTLIKPKLELVDSKFLMYYLNSPKIKHLANQSTSGIGVQNLNVKVVRKFPIKLPPLPEQQRIARLLDEADKLRQLNQQLIQKYEQLTQSLFLEMFGDPVTNPKGWEKQAINSLIEPVKKIDKSYNHKTINYIDIASINNSKNTITGSTIYDLDEKPSRAQQILNENDILFSTVRPNLKNIAINHSNGFIASTGFFVFRTKKEILKPFFLFEALKTDSITNYFVGITSGANYPAIKNSDMKKFQMILPPPNLQFQFAERVGLIEMQKQQAQEALQKSEDLFNSLLQQVFKG